MIKNHIIFSDLDNQTKMKNYKVDISPILNGNIGCSCHSREYLLREEYELNRYGCCCHSPRFKVEECQIIADYPALNHIHVVSRLESPEDEVVVWAIYPDIALIH